jgi:hypothetical protein
VNEIHEKEHLASEAGLAGLVTERLGRFKPVLFLKRLVSCTSCVSW